MNQDVQTHLREPDTTHPHVYFMRMKRMANWFGQTNPEHLHLLDGGFVEGDASRNCNGNRANCIKSASASFLGLTPRFFEADCGWRGEVGGDGAHSSEFPSRAFRSTR